MNRETKTLLCLMLNLLLGMSTQAAAGELVDPTKPAYSQPASTVTRAPTLRVEAVLLSDGARVAIVNGKLVRAGDRIGTARIDAVLVDGIRFTRDGQQHTAFLNDKALRIRTNAVPHEEET